MSRCYSRSGNSGGILGTLVGTSCEAKSTCENIQKLQGHAYSAPKQDPWGQKALRSVPNRNPISLSTTRGPRIVSKNDSLYPHDFTFRASASCTLESIAG